MKCVAIALGFIGLCIGAGIVFHWTGALMFGCGVALPYVTAMLFGRRCTFANGVTYIVLKKAGIWRALLADGSRVSDHLKLWYDEKMKARR